MTIPPDYLLTENRPAEFYYSIHKALITLNYFYNFSLIKFSWQNKADIEIIKVRKTVKTNNKNIIFHQLNHVDCLYYSIY